MCMWRGTEVSIANADLSALNIFPVHYVTAYRNGVNGMFLIIDRKYHVGTIRIVVCWPSF